MRRNEIGSNLTASRAAEKMGHVSNHENLCLSLVFRRASDRGHVPAAPGGCRGETAAEIFRPSGRRRPLRGDRSLVSRAERPVRFPHPGRRRDAQTLSLGRSDRRPSCRPPHFVFNGHWGIRPDGTIVVDPKLSDWDNGDIGQRSASLLFGLAGYYRYTGDAAAVGLIALTADYLLDYCQTPADHPWPGFLISCPTRARPTAGPTPTASSNWTSAPGRLGHARGLQADAASRATGRPSSGWADLLAAHCDTAAGPRPWNRYANPQDCKWNTRQTGGVALVFQFLDDVIRPGIRRRRTRPC